MGACPGGAVTPWYLSGGILAANCIAAYTPKGAVNQAASYDNNAAPGNGLPDGTYDAVAVVAPTWNAATGWTFDGINQVLTTGILPDSDQTWSVIVRLANRTNDSAVIQARDSVAGTSRFGFYMTAAVVYYYDGTIPGGAVSVAPQLVTGIVAVAGTQGYRNGIAEGAALGGFTGVINRNIPIGASTSGVAAYGLYYAGDVLATAIYDAALTAPQVLAVATAMAAL